MCNASSEREVEAGIAILDSIDRQSEIPADQHEVIDAILRGCPILCVRGLGLQVVRESVGVSHG